MITGKFVKTNYRENAGPRNSTVYSVNVDGTWYGGWWDNPPTAVEGDIVEFDATQKGDFWNGNPKTFRVVTPAGAAPISSAGAALITPPVRVSPDAHQRQNSIVYQSSRKDAIQLAGVLLQHDCLPLGSKKADKASIVLDYIDDLTADFAWAANNPEIVSPDERLQSQVMDEVQGGMDD